MVPHNNIMYMLAATEGEKPSPAVSAEGGDQGSTRERRTEGEAGHAAPEVGKDQGGIQDVLRAQPWMPSREWEAAMVGL